METLLLFLGGLFRPFGFLLSFTLILFLLCGCSDSAVDGFSSFHDRELADKMVRMARQSGYATGFCAGMNAAFAQNVSNQTKAAFQAYFTGLADGGTWAATLIKSRTDLSARDLQNQCARLTQQWIMTNQAKWYQPFDTNAVLKEIRK